MPQASAQLRHLAFGLLIPAVAGAQLRAPCAPLTSSFALNFSAPVAGTIGDASGVGTGLRDRLAGTGTTFGATDPNLQLDPTAGVLRIRSTNSDINGQVGLAAGEYAGINLSRLGFTGTQDFCVGAQFRNVRYAEAFDQFGLYIGSGAGVNFRAGYLFSGSRTLFSVLNNGGFDSGISLATGPAEGSDLFISIGRVGGQYFFDANGVSLLLGAQPSFLNGFSDLNVGMFAANARNPNSKTATVDDFMVVVGSTTPVPEPSALLLFGAGVVLVTLLRVMSSRGSRAASDWGPQRKR
jgi:hypothetical protein